MSMEPFRFIHASGLLLDRGLAGTEPLPDEWRDVVERAPVTAFQRVIEACVQHDVDFLLLTGDSFDQSDLGLDGLVELAGGLAELDQHGIPVYIACGESDPWGAWLPGVRLPENVVRLVHGASGIPVVRDGVTLATLCPCFSADSAGHVADTRAEAANGLTRAASPTGSSPLVIGIAYGDLIDDRAAGDQHHADAEADAAEWGSSWDHWQPVQQPSYMGAFGPAPQAHEERAADEPVEANELILLDSASENTSHIADEADVADAPPVDNAMTPMTVPVPVPAHGARGPRVSELLSWSARHGRVHYWALGGAESRRTVWLGQGLAHDPGHPQGRRANEAGPRGCTLIEVNSDGLLQPTFLSTAPVRWERLHIQIWPEMQSLDLEQAMQAAVQHVERHSGDKLWLVTWTLEGRGPLMTQMARPEFRAALLERLHERELLVGVEVRTHTVVFGKLPTLSDDQQGSRLAAEFLRDLAARLENPDWSLERCLAESPVVDGPWRSRLQELLPELTTAAVGNAACQLGLRSFAAQDEGTP